MNSFSNVTLVGRLTRNAELKNTQSGSSVLNFSIAIDKRKRSSDGTFVDEAIYVEVAYFSQNAMSICSFLEKGVMVGVTGELNQRRWVANDGTNQSRIEVLANNIHLIESKEATELRRSRQTGSQEVSSQPSASQRPQGNFTRAGMNLAKSTVIKQPEPAALGPDSFDDDQDVPF